jgi:nucleolar protein 15
MVTTRLASKTAVSEGKVLSPLRKLPSPKRTKRGPSAAARESIALKKAANKKNEEEAEKELQKALKEKDNEEQKVEEDDEAENEDEVPVAESSDEEIEGFESTDDEQEEEDNNLDGSDAEEEQPQQEEEKAPKQKKELKKVETHEVKQLPKDSKQISKKQSKVEKGVIYIGRLPEGFEEAELTKYFNQFGDILNVKVPRNKTTGRSKHFAFVEFSNKDDASVAQETMNNYLILNHQLKVNLVDDEFKETKKFRKNYFKVAKLTNDVKTLNSKVQKKRKQRKDALKAAGIKF